MKILLTGASGFLGNNLLRLLLEDGHDVLATVRQSSNRQAFDGLGVELTECDLLDAKEIGSAVASADVLIHSAAHIRIGWSDLELSRKINMTATQLLARTARMHGTRMILVSTVDTLAAGSLDKWIDEQQTTPPKIPCSYVKTKREAELAFAEQVEAGLDGLIVHPGFMLGPWDWKPSSGQMLLAVKQSWTPLAPAGGCSAVDVRDVAGGIVSAIEHGKAGENYILAGENVTYLQLWRKMAEITGGRGPVGTLPNWLNSIAGWCGDAAAKLSGKEGNVNSAATQMGAMYHWYTSDKAKQKLGYKIGNLDDAISDAWQWFKGHGYAK